jgi:hypothetical protein
MKQSSKTHTAFKHMTDDNHITILKNDSVKSEDFVGYTYSHSTETTDVWVKTKH